LIWSYFVAKEFDDGYDRLLEYSKVVQESNDLTEGVRQNGAHWIGRVMAALELGLDSIQSREAWLQTEAKLLAQMSADLTIAYNDGKEEVHAKHLVLESEIKLAREKEKERQGKKIEEIGKSLDAADTKRENLKKSAAELKEEFEEQSTAYKKQMERMEKDYAIMERRGMTLLTQMLTFDQQINMMQNNRNVNQSFASLAALQSRRGLLDTEFQMTANATQQLAATAQRMTQDRADFVAQYEKATGDITKEEAGVKKWKERTEKHAEELKKVAKKPVGPAGGLNSKIQAATTFRTYVDLDLAVERENVLKSFRVADGGK
jgi:chromosome segregation ATPase